MRKALLLLPVLAAACATPPPPPPTVESESIETAALTPATRAPTPTAPPGPATPPDPRDLPPALSLAQVEKTFDHHRRYFADLYLERVKVRPKLTGTVYVSFVVQPNGSARSVALSGSTVGDRVLERAVLEQIARMAFPPAASETPILRYPLVFSPK